MIFVSKYLVPNGYLGLTLFPFVFLKKKELKQDAVFINHERIHLKQQLELLVIPFYFWYVIEFVFRLFQYKKWHLAYRNISFEREAYLQEKKLEYIKNRPFWAFLKYLRRHDF
ncbi:hypothetical protein [Neotamlana laminarinivorans]|uniref:Uncharacterized protein n=1 Tax=Neotamlana laminarinivorans TaxID=2883124 RepID=A0A9X1I319_9FLAO|nr:hypothetical protein [Tamlana laminarinivorans]MCB4799432.1 hypothetical protein [Tamlana laminarinivorans]